MSKSAKHNALKHGASSQAVMLWSERSSDYETLAAALTREWFPEGSSEEYLVHSLVELRWRRQRLERYERLEAQKRFDQICIANSHRRDWDLLRSFANLFELAKNKKQVEHIIAELGSYFGDLIQQLYPLKTGDDPLTWGVRIAKQLRAIRTDPPQEKANEFLAMVDLNQFDQHLARTERVDAMIDRTIKRLIQLKTMKQMNRSLTPKLIDMLAPGTTLENDSH